MTRLTAGPGTEAECVKAVLVLAFDAEMLYEGLTAGNPSELAVYPGGIHAFNAYPIALAQKANNRISEFIRHAADDYTIGAIRS